MTQPLPEGEYAEVGPGLRMHYHSLGKGPVVLFLHGSGPGASGWSNFRSNAAFFAAQGYRCILPDSLGYGLSSKPTDRPYTLGFMAGGAVTLMDALGVDRFTIVGNSQGGAQALQIALDHGERVEKLVLHLKEQRKIMQEQEAEAQKKKDLTPPGEGDIDPFRRAPDNRPRIPRNPLAPRRR